MTWVAAGIGTASLASGIFGSRKADKAAASAAESQAKLTGVQRRAEIQDMEDQSEFEQGMVRATVGASNIQMSGSAQRYSDATQMRNMREIAMAKKAAHLEQRAILKGAQGAGDGLLAQGVGDAVGSFIQAGSNWVNKAPAPVKGSSAP